MPVVYEAEARKSEAENKTKVIHRRSMPETDTKVNLTSVMLTDQSHNQWEN